MKKFSSHDRPSAEMKIYGVNACQMAFKKRPEAIVRVYLKEKLLKEFSALIEYCVSKRLAYHVVDDEDLEKVSQSTHHEGVALLVRSPQILGLKEYLKQKKNPELFLGLEKIENPHNLGAILRAAAHFGVHALLIPEAKKQFSGAVYRVAQGGAEWVDIVDVPNWKEGFALLKEAQFALYATSSHRGQSLFKTSFKKKSLILLGPEKEGLSSELMKNAGQIISIPGTNTVESLNVSTAAAVILGHYWLGHKVN